MSVTIADLESVSTKFDEKQYINFLTNLNQIGPQYITIKYSSSGVIKIPSNLEVLNTLFKKLYLKYVEVRESKFGVDNKGVFAKDDIPAGTLITLYNIKALRFNVEGHSTESYVTYNSNSIYPYYCFRINKNILCIADRVYLNSNYFGNYINDGFQYKNNDTVYREISKRKSNCEIRAIGHIPCFIGVITTRDIRKDEEIFINYGLECAKKNAETNGII